MSSLHVPGGGKFVPLEPRHWLYVGCPTTTPSTMTWIVEPSVGMMFGPGVSAQPKIVIVPDTVAPCPGVSSVPNGSTDDWFVPVTVRDPSSVTLLLAS